jgi:hypothetical protein
MIANSSELPEAEETALEPEPLRKFGQNVLGIAFHSDDWEKDIPLAYFQDEGEDNPFGDGGSNG